MSEMTEAELNELDLRVSQGRMLHCAKGQRLVNEIRRCWRKVKELREETARLRRRLAETKLALAYKESCDPALAREELLSRFKKYEEQTNG